MDRSLGHMDNRRHIIDIDREMSMLSKAKEREELILEQKNQILKYEMKFSQLEQESSIANRQIVMLKEENIILKEQINNINRLEANNSDMIKKLRYTQEKLTYQQQLMQESDTRLSVEISKNEHLTRELAAKNEMIDGLSIEVKKHKETIESLEQTIDDQNETISKMTDDNNKLSADLNKADHVIKNLLRKIAGKPVIHSDGTVVHPNHETNRNTNTSSTIEDNIVDEHDDKINELMKENESLRKDLVKAEHIIKNLLRKLAGKPIVHSDGTVVYSKSQQ